MTTFSTKATAGRIPRKRRGIKHDRPSSSRSSTNSGRQQSPQESRQYTNGWNQEPRREFTVQAGHPRKLFVRQTWVPNDESPKEANLRKSMLEVAFHKYGNAALGSMGKVKVYAPCGRKFAKVEVKNEAMADLALKEMSDHFSIAREQRRVSVRSAPVFSVPVAPVDYAAVTPIFEVEDGEIAEGY